MNKHIRLLSVLFLSHQITISMSLAKPKQKAKPAATHTQSSDLAAAEFELRSMEGAPLLSEEGVVASAPSMYEPLERIVVVHQQVPVTASATTAAAAIPTTTSAASLYPALPANQKSNVEATASVALNATKPPQALGSLADQKKSRETIKYVFSQAMLEELNQLNDRRRAEPIIRSKVQKLYPKVPLFLVEEKLASLFDASSIKKGTVYDADSIKLGKNGLFAMEVYTRCIPILNGEEKLKGKIKAQYQHLTDDDIRDQALKLLKLSIKAEIAKISKKIYGNDYCLYHMSHTYCSADSSSCGFNHAYEWVVGKWKTTKEAKDSDAIKILEEITEIECTPEASKSSASSKSDCAIQ